MSLPGDGVALLEADPERRVMCIKMTVVFDTGRSPPYLIRFHFEILLLLLLGSRNYSVKYR